MSNLMTNIYIGYIVEIIYQDNVPNFNLRIRVPSIHGTNSQSGIPDTALPIAKPMFNPGLSYNKELFEKTIQNINKVYVLFESGNFDNPVYFGLKNNSNLNTIPANSVQTFFFEDLESFPEEGLEGCFYWDQTTALLYYWESVSSEYVAVGITGPQGPQGEPGIPGEDGQDGEDGLPGEPGVDARAVDLIADQLSIEYDPAGNRPEEAITLTAIPRNTPVGATLYYEFFIDEVSQGSPTTTATFDYTPALTYSITPITIRVDLREELATNPVVATDTVSLYPVKSGDDTLTFILSNSTHSFSANLAGVVQSYENSGTTITVLQGADKLQFETGTGFPTTNGKFRVQAVDLNITVGTITVSGTDASVANATAMSDSEESASILFNVYIKNKYGKEVVLSAEQTFSKSKQGLEGADGADGSDGLDARAVDLLSSQLAIEYDTQGNRPEEDITLTAYPKNFEDVPYYEFFVNNVSQGSPTTTATFSYTPALTYSNDPITIEVEVREGSVVNPILARDETTLYPVKSGSDTITIIQSNSNHTLTSDSNGIVSDYTGSGNIISVLQGINKLQFEVGTGFPTTAGKFRIAATGNGIDVGSITVSGKDALIASADEMTTDKATIDYVISIRSFENINLDTIIETQSFSKSKQGEQGLPGADGADGAAGLDARAVDLIASQLAIEYNTEGNRPEEDITLTAYPKNFEGTVYYEFFVNNVSQNSPTTTATFDYTPALTYSNTPITIEVEVREGSATNPILARDETTLYPVKSGSDTIVIIPSNNNHTLTANALGVVTDYAGSGQTISVLEGLNKLQFETGTGSPTTNGRFRITANATNITTGSITVSGKDALVADASNITAAVATIDYTIRIKSFNGVILDPIVERQSFSISKEGNEGQPGTDGTDGLPAYIHYAYATSADGQTNFSTSSFTGATYIGIYTDFTEADSTDYQDYEWSLFKGADGEDGQDGQDGLSAYIHYAYATSANGSTGFSLTYTGVETYVGWYSDFTLADSTNYQDYEWSLFKGADGQDGEDGQDGQDGAPAKAVFLTASVYSINYAANETTPSPSGNITLTATHQNFTTPRYRFTLDGTVGSWQTGNTATYAIPDNYFSIPKTMKVDVAEGAASTTVVATDSVTIVAVKTGADGPGIVFRGVYDASKTYTMSSIRKDVVQYPDDAGNYYIAKVDGITGVWDANKWTQFTTEFSSVATGLLIAEQSFVKETINIGTNTEGNANIAIVGGGTSPYISLGQQIQGYDQQGIFLGTNKRALTTVSTVSSPGSTGAVSITPSLGVKYIYKAGANFFANDALGSWVVMSNANSKMYGYISYLSSGVANWAGVTVTSFEGTTAYSSWTVTISKQVFSIKGTQTNSFKWDGDSLDIIGDIGGTIGQINIGNPPTNGIRISSTGIQAWNASTQTFLLSGATGNAEFKGTIQATAGNIAGWGIQETKLVASNNNAVIKSNPNPEIFLGPNVGNLATFTYPQEVGYTTGIVNGALGMYDTYSISGSAPFVPNGVRSMLMSFDTDNQTFLFRSNLILGTLNSHITIRSRNNLMLHSDNNYVYASRTGTPSSADAARVVVGTSGVSTKLVKTEIENLDYAEVNTFLETIEPKKFKNLIKDKQKISLIIEDEEEKNLPYKEMLFKREEKLYKFSQLPDFLQLYKDDETVIEKELNENGEIIAYYFSPKVLDEQTLTGLILASTKYNHNRIKKLEQENIELRQIIARILNKIGEV